MLDQLPVDVLLALVLPRLHPPRAFSPALLALSSTCRSLHTLITATYLSSLTTLCISRPHTPPRHVLRWALPAVAPAVLVADGVPAGVLDGVLKDAASASGNRVAESAKQGGALRRLCEVAAAYCDDVDDAAVQTLLRCSGVGLVRLSLPYCRGMSDGIDWGGGGGLAVVDLSWSGLGDGAVTRLVGVARGYVVAATGGGLCCAARIGLLERAPLGAPVGCSRVMHV